MHMALAELLIADFTLPRAVCDLLSANWGAFLFGGIAPDARVSSGLQRADTHFFEYGPKVEPPVPTMLERFPQLERHAISEHEQAAFVAGYTAHLAMDAVWCTDLLFPVFVDSDWGTQATKFLVLHLLLAYLDRRDRALLPGRHYDQLANTTPHHWLPFIDDASLVVWRDTIASQLAPGAASQTVAILSQRLNRDPAEIQSMLDDEAEMQRLTWANVPMAKLHHTEEAMYHACFETISAYLS
jgi:hypothetical protein